MRLKKSFNARRWLKPIAKGALVTSPARTVLTYIHRQMADGAEALVAADGFRIAYAWDGWQGFLPEWVGFKFSQVLPDTPRFPADPYPFTAEYPAAGWLEVAPYRKALRAILAISDSPANGVTITWGDPVRFACEQGDLTLPIPFLDTFDGLSFKVNSLWLLHALRPFKVRFWIQVPDAFPLPLYVGEVGSVLTVLMPIAHRTLHEVENISIEA